MATFPPSPPLVFPQSHAQTPLSWAQTPPASSRSPNRPVLAPYDAEDVALCLVANGPNGRPGTAPHLQEASAARVSPPHPSESTPQSPHLHPEETRPQRRRQPHSSIHRGRVQLGRAPTPQALGVEHPARADLETLKLGLAVHSLQTGTNNHRAARGTPSPATAKCPPPVVHKRRQGLPAAGGSPLQGPKALGPDVASDSAQLTEAAAPAKLEGTKEQWGHLRRL
ncbi:hypothetical protein CYMTET_36185, partial [Cymbomonas tetramitiformis]